MIQSLILEYDLGHLDGSLFHLLVVLLLPPLLCLDRIHQVIRLSLLNELELGNHPLDDALLDDEEHGDVEHGEEEVNL